MNKKSIILSFISAFTGGIAALALAGIFQYQQSKSGGFFSQQPNLPVQRVNYTGEKEIITPDFGEAAEKTIHSVVHIKTQYLSKSSVYDDFFGFGNPFNDFFRGMTPYGQLKPQPIIATGSGVIISDEGYIVTNNHVVQDANEIEVTLNDKRTFNARLIGNDPSTDLALLKIDAKDIYPITWGNSDNVKIGEWVLAVGNPFNLTSTVTAGIISAKARNINILGSNSAIESFLQTDAAVNSGNSGGALVNTKGELIGINAAIASNTGAYTGYSFAIPVNIVKKVVEDFIQYGEVQRAYMGVNIQDINSELAKEKGITDMQGVYVESVVPGGAAQAAGLQSGDIILSLNSIPVNSRSELVEIVAQHRPGEKIAVEYKRGSKIKIELVELLNKNGSSGVVKKEEIVSALGAEFETVPKEDLKKLGIENGVRVKKLGNGKLKSAGIREGFIITSVDKKPVKSPTELTDLLSSKKGGILMEGVYENGMRAYYGFGL